MFDAEFTLQEPEQHPVMSHECHVVSRESSMRRQLIIEMTGGTKTLSHPGGGREAGLGVQGVQHIVQQHNPPGGESKFTLLLRPPVIQGVLTMHSTPSRYT